MIVYDGECYFCVGTVMFLKKHLSYFPDARPNQRTPFSMTNLTKEETAKYVWYIKGGKYYKGFRVLSELLKQQPEPQRRILGYFVSVPPLSWIFDLGYFAVSHNRKRLSKLFFNKQMQRMCAEC